MRATNKSCNEFRKGHVPYSNKISAPTSLNFLQSKTSKIYKNSSCTSFDGKLREPVDFNFKYVSKPELEAVVKRVRRAKQKIHDEEEWKYFLKLRKDQNAVESPESCSADLQCCSGTASESVRCSDCGLLYHYGTEPVQSIIQEDFLATEEDETRLTDPVSTVNQVPTVVSDNVSHTYQLGPGITKRLHDLVSAVGRMTAMLLNPTTGYATEDEDADRAVKRSLEFDAMFSRNHLYEIQRLLKDTKQMASTKNSNTMELEVKISNALKSVTQALQVYTRHVSKGSRVKYQQVVPIFHSITTTLEHIEHLTGVHQFPMRKEIEVSCSYMRQLLLEMSCSEAKTVSTVSRTSVSRARHRHKPSADLSMYNRRQKADWRRKTATLARQRFGPPTVKKSCKLSSAAKENSIDKVVSDYRDVDGGAFERRDLDKTQNQSKEASGTKEAPFRNATRAVPEERVTTMMEMIPHEPSDDADLSINIDDSTFQALKLLNGTSCHVVKEDDQNNVEHNKDRSFNLVKSLSQVDVPSSSSSTSALPVETVSCRTISPTRTDVISNCNKKSTTREPTNVKLVCLVGVDKPSLKSLPHNSTQVDEEPTIDSEDNRKTLVIGAEEKTAALVFQKKMAEYQASCPHYKDGKALDIVDRLATNILSEMIMDFQREEMDEVIRTLYNLEFDERD